ACTLSRSRRIVPALSPAYLPAQKSYRPPPPKRDASPAPKWASGVPSSRHSYPEPTPPHQGCEFLQSESRVGTVSPLSTSDNNLVSKSSPSNARTPNTTPALSYTAVRTPASSRRLS